MKKLLLSVLVVILSLSLIACGSDDNKENPTPTETVTTTPEAATEALTATPEATATPVPTEAEVDNGTDVAGAEDAVVGGPDEIDPAGGVEIDVVPTEDPEVKEDPTEVPTIVGSSESDDELLGVWVVDRDAFFEYYVQLMLAEYEEGSDEYNQMLEYAVTYREELEGYLGEVYEMTVTFEEGNVITIGNSTESETGIYEVSGNVITAIDDGGEVINFTYDPSANTITLVDEADGITIAFIKENGSTAGGDDIDVTPTEAPAEIIPGATQYDYTGSPISSLDEVAGTWTVNSESVIEILKSAYAEYMTVDEFNAYLEEGAFDSILESSTITLYISTTDTCYMDFAGEKQELYVEPCEVGVLLSPLETPDEEVVTAYYDAENDALIMTEEGYDFYMIFTR